ncbi:MAG TPA: MaoC/PaaZ C-terminal domain-containing protein [Candidatus Acidoferrales bacterium]|nr:MaoC/PaaZ C-terminal domain-containing protein [Candidatus Acidoferrales bacterium]
MKELTVTFSRAQIEAYARASGDLNPIHLDDAFARRVGLPGVIAHGMLQMGLAARVVGGGARLRRLSVRFAAMVQPGDTITFSAASEGERIPIGAHNQSGQPVLTKAEAEIAPEPGRA